MWEPHNPFTPGGGYVLSTADFPSTPDLCSDSPPLWRNSLKPGVMDGNLTRPEEPIGTVIVPLMCPRSIFGDLCPTSLPETISGRDSANLGTIYHKESGALRARLLPRIGRGRGSKLEGELYRRQVASGSLILEVEQC